MGDMTDQYAVFGNPVAHSKSPKIHRLFAEQTDQDLSHSAQLVPQDSFNRAADDFFRGGGHGLNVTVPFKQQAFDYVSFTSDRAACAGAVNTLVFQDDKIIGDNTDGIGLVTDMVENLGWTITGKRFLIIGAGGATRGILQPLLDQNPQHIVIANRSVDKALALAKRFSESGYLLGCGIDMLPGQSFDVIINATSAALTGSALDLPDSLLSDQQANCYDLMYAAEPTDFLRWAAAGGAKTADGLGMLVEQAAASFALWRGIAPRTNNVIAQLRASL